MKHFLSEKELLDFSELFLDNQVTTFRKDIAICLKSDKAGRHAYFPALMRCIAFLDLLSGLYAGKLKWHGLAELKRYANKFMNPNYDALRLEIVYEGFRHKIAHLGHPYVVFDTPARRVAWTVNASRHSPAIRLNALPSTTLKKTRTPWPVQYDHRIRISLRSFSSDIVQSIYGPSGYLKHLQSEPTARKRFEKCMNDFYPP